MIAKALKRARKALEIGPQWVRHQRRLRLATPVLVHHMGKVGSTSIYRSVARAWPGVVLKAHKLPDHADWRVRNLYRRTVRNGRSLKVISPVREPIGRNISTFFQTFDRMTGRAFEESNFSLDELRGMFLSRLDHEVPLEWFDKNTLRFFGIDVYGRPFPERGYETYSSGKVELLVMRLELPDEVKRKVVSNFLGLADLDLISDNVGAEKVYADTYRSFKSRVSLHEEYMDAMCESRYFRHFYDDETIEAVRSRWTQETHGEDHE